MSSLVITPLPVDPWIRFLGTTVGRDKVYRTIQYFSRFLAYFIGRTGGAVAFKETIQRLNALSVAIGAGRKLFRIGKPLDSLQMILKSLSIKDEFIKTTTILKATGYGGWLVLDMLQWLHSQKVFDLSNQIPAINKYAPRLWLLGILASLASNLYKIQTNFAQKQIEFGSMRKLIIDKDSKKLAKDALQDLIDLIIPLSLIGTIDASPGVVGLAGTITSILGATSAWPTS